MIRRSASKKRLCWRIGRSACRFPALHRLWQLLLKGLAEVQAAPVPLQAAEMALLRLIHASDLPDPAELVKRLQEGRDLPAAQRLPGGSGERPARASTRACCASARTSTVAPRRNMPRCPTDFEALVTLFRDRMEPRLAHLLTR